MNDFINIIQNKEKNAANLFIKNSRALQQDNKVELARELTDLRVQLQEIRERVDEVTLEMKFHREGGVFQWFLLGLFVTTLTLLGISYIYI